MWLSNDMGSRVGGVFQPTAVEKAWPGLSLTLGFGLTLNPKP